MAPLALLAFAAAAFVIVSVILDWDWFFGHPKAKFFVDRLGRAGARLFYAALACALVVLGFICSGPGPL